MIRYAAENGFDAITWDVGATQAERYKLSNQVDSVHVWQDEDGRYAFEAMKNGAVLVEKNRLSDKELADSIGKDLAQKAVDDIEAGKPANYRGLEMDLGGEGMTGFYDKIIPAEIGKYVKPMGGRVDRATVSGEVPAWRVHMTPKMREIAMDGQPMFSKSAAFENAKKLFQDSIQSPHLFSFLNRFNTQYYKATKSPEFMAFWLRANLMFQDGNRATARPAKQAQNILPSFDSSNVMKAVRTLAGLEKGVTEKDLQSAHGALMAGTFWGGASPTKGRTFTKAELMQGFIDKKTGKPVKLTANQADLYLEARKAVDASLDEAAAATAFRVVRPWFKKTDLHEYMAEDPKLAESLVDVAMDGLIDPLKDEINTLKQSGLKENAQGTSLDDLEKQLADLQTARGNAANVFKKAKDLQKAGYMPASRFGEYRVSVTVTRPSTLPIGKNVLYVAHYDTSFEANRARRQLVEMYPAAQGYSVSHVDVMDKEQWKLFKGVDPETVMLFADEAGIKPDAVMQEWYQTAVNNRSALTHLIHRKGYAGFSTDLPRSLAAFLTSNGKYVGQSYHNADLVEMASNEKISGEVRKESRELLEYIQSDSTGELATKVRGVMASWYLLGSVASATVNATQTVTQSLPYLYGNGAKSIIHAAELLGNAYKTVIKKNYGSELAQAIKRAEQDGTIDSSEVFHLYAEAVKPWVNKITDRNLQNRARAFSFLWGAPFSLVEKLNRQATFIAAYRLANENGKTGDEAFKFAEKAVMETQGLYAKVNRPNWARGTVGSMAFTFKQFTIAYLEQMARMAKSGPAGQRAAALQFAILMGFSGLLGAPGEDDIEDAIDTLAQTLFGKAFLTRQALQSTLNDVLGKELAQFALHGVSAFTPVDISGRMGMGNLLPGTAMLKPSEPNPGREITSFFGPAGSMMQNMSDAARLMLNEGAIGRAAKLAAPSAIGNLVKGMEMASTGEMRNMKGQKIADADMVDAVAQSLGFQPQKKAEYAQARYPVQELLGFRNSVERSIADDWAQAIHDKDSEGVAKARERLMEWNAANPKMRIAINGQQIISRLKAMAENPLSRMARTAPKEVRGNVRQMLQ
jgi:hypothetical protein